jgi:hypothetical protein
MYNRSKMDLACSSWIPWIKNIGCAPEFRAHHLWRWRRLFCLSVLSIKEEMKKKQTNKILIIAGAGVAAYIVMQLLKKKNTATQIPMYQNQYPQPPAKNTPDFAMWVKQISDTYKNAAWLFQPGGPFYKAKVDQNYVKSVLNQPVVDYTPAPSDSGSSYRYNDYA